MTGRVASLARFAPAAFWRAADVFVSVAFWADAHVNSLLTSPWSGWTSACDDTPEDVPTREGAGNVASTVLLSWPQEVTHACPPDGGGGLTPCCHLTPFELPRNHRMTTIPAEVTCGLPEGAWR